MGVQALAKVATETDDAVLHWGRHYAMVRPDHFRVDYVINPYMDLASQPNPTAAIRQWRRLGRQLQALGAQVDVIHQQSDAPDMVFAMNLGLAVTDWSGPRVALSHMRFAQRRLETAGAQTWFANAGYASTWPGTAGVGPFMEAGDAFPFMGSLIVGYGPRTEEAALDWLASEFGIHVVGVQITHPGMYHLDLAFCPLDATTALVCPAAFAPSSAQTLLSLVPDPIVLTEAEALTFCANSVVVGRTVVMPACPIQVLRELERRGFSVELVDVSEFHKAGGSVRCLTNPLDILMGRDLDNVPGGQILHSV